MATYSIDIGTNKVVIADEVLSSALRVLSIAGFDRDEVCELFSQAIQQLRDDEESSTHDDEQDPVLADDVNEDGVYSILDRYEELDEQKALSRLGRRAEIIGDLSSSAERARAQELLDKALPLARASQDWLVAECARHGVELQANRDNWLASASDNDLDREDEIVFIDDYRFNQAFRFDIISSLIRGIANAGDQEAFKTLLNSMSENTVILDQSVMDDLQEAGESLKFIETFIDFLVGLQGQGEQLQSNLFDHFVRQSGFSGGTYVLEGWLDAFVATGRVDRYKRSNRWRVLVH